MKKSILLVAMALATTTVFNSCSSRDDDPAEQTEKQDFTNAKYIKSILVGKWEQTEYSYNGSTWSTAGGYKPVYTFNTDDTYKYQNTETEGIFTENGTYNITPVVGESNAFLKFNYTYENQAKMRSVTLRNYEAGVVTISYIFIGSPTGIYYEKFKKK